MSYIKIPRYPVRHGQEAIDALRKYVKEINGEENEELTERQKAALTRVAQALISSLENETGGARAGVGWADIKKAILRPFQKPSHQIIERQVNSSHPYLHSELTFPDQIR